MSETPQSNFSCKRVVHLSNGSVEPFRAADNFSGLCAKTDKLSH